MFLSLDKNVWGESANSCFVGHILEKYQKVGVIENEGVPFSRWFWTLRTVMEADATINSPVWAKPGEKLVSQVVIEDLLGKIIKNEKIFPRTAISLS